MKLDQILAAFALPLDAVAAVKGGIQLGMDTWGVFDGDRFEVVVRNPHVFPCHLRLCRNTLEIGKVELDIYESRSFPIDGRVDIEDDFHALFTNEELPTPEQIAENPTVADDLNMISDGLRVVSLGGTRSEVLTDAGIDKAGKIAARELFNAFTRVLDPDDPLRHYGWHFEKGSTVEQAAASMETTTEDAEEWISTYKGIREKYLFAMMQEAKARVQSQLTLVRSLLSPC